MSIKRADHNVNAYENVCVFQDSIVCNQDVIFSGKWKVFCDFEIKMMLTKMMFANCFALDGNIKIQFTNPASLSCYHHGTRLSKSGRVPQKECSCVLKALPPGRCPNAPQSGNMQISFWVASYWSSFNQSVNETKQRNKNWVLTTWKLRVYLAWSVQPPRSSDRQDDMSPHLLPNWMTGSANHTHWAFARTCTGASKQQAPTHCTLLC